MTRSVLNLLLGAFLTICVPQFGQCLDSGAPFTEIIHTERAFELRMIDAIRDHIPHVMRADGTPGLNIALAYQGRLIWEAGYGWADVANRTPMTPATVYHSGSLGKTYTATAIMHLVDRGVIALQDPINKHLPIEVHNPLGERDITVRDLMTHSSGLGTDDALSLWWKPRPLAVEVKEEYGKKFSSMMGGEAIPRWIGKVGGQFNYSNLGLATLGLIVETANPDELNFSDYVQKYVMDPLGMSASQYPPSQHIDWVRPDIWKAMSMGYSTMGSAWIRKVPVYFGEAPAGSVLARPSDHIRLLLAMSNGGEHNGYQVLQPESVEQMLTPSGFDFTGRNDLNIGLIWLLKDHGKPTFSFAHSGGHMFGWLTEGEAWPEFGAAVMIAVNHWRIPDSVAGGSKLTRFIGDWIAGQPPDVAYRELTPEWAWKVSYVRGALFGAAHSTWVGIPGEMPFVAIDNAIEQTRVMPGRRNDWNPEAFRAGLSDMQAAGPSMGRTVGFWTSGACKVSLEDARQAYLELGGQIPGSMSMMMPFEKAE